MDGLWDRTGSNDGFFVGVSVGWCVRILDGSSVVGNKEWCIDGKSEA